MTVKASAPDRPHVFTIPPGMGFVDALASGVLGKHGDDPPALAAVRLLLPTRRACRAMAEAFLRQTGGRPLLLPRITPIGDVDEDDLGLDFSGEDELAVDLALPSAIPPLRRQLLLMRTVLADERRDATPEQAARLAGELGRLLDQAAIEGVELRGLPGLVPLALADHWQKTVAFLEIITEHWPVILDQEGCLDAADRRNRLLRAQAEAWRAEPPRAPVIAAGSTGSIPATAELLAVVSRLPDGAVVLPGLDCEADDETWAALEPTHPQYGMARLLERVGIDRRQVRNWPAAPPSKDRAARFAAINRALRPAANAVLARDASSLPPRALSGVTRIDAPGPAEEARAIALIMRGSLEEPQKTAALVTPDRGLARRVAGELRRWGIEVDDSAGVPLLDTGPATFLRLVVRMAAEELAPVPLLAALKHPLAAGGLAPADFRRRVRRLELALLRGPRPEPGIAGLRAGVAEKSEHVCTFVERLSSVMAPLSAALETERMPLADLVRAHVAAAEALAATDRETGANRLWSGEAGEAAAQFVAELCEAASGLGVTPVSDYPLLFDALAGGRVVRPRWGRHPRLFIWGPLEARLQQTDVTILGGLNEETWPPKVRAGPWMSRPMMKALGLPLPERRIGLSAHDFVQAFAAPAVYLTRARRAEGAPTVACRWLLRLQALIAGDPGLGELDNGAKWLAWQEALDAPQRAEPVAPPAPCPPLGARPRKLRVTEIETWMRDPYALYARRILGLKPCDPLDAELGPREFGTFVHEAVHAFLTETGTPGDDARARLLAAGRRALGNAWNRPEVRTFWWPRFERVAAWLITHDGSRAHVLHTASEVNGTMILDAAGGSFELIARADRIDGLADGSLAVIDYKTGVAPSAKQIEAGFSPQLPLEAMIAAVGGFEGVAAADVSHLEFWRLGANRTDGEVKAAGKDPAALAEAACNGLKTLVTTFDLPETAYRARPRSAFAPPYSDYEHLERVREWAAVGAEDGE